VCVFPRAGAAPCCWSSTTAPSQTGSCIRARARASRGPTSSSPTLPPASPRTPSSRDGDVLNVAWPRGCVVTRLRHRAAAGHSRSLRTSTAAAAAEGRWGRLSETCVYIRYQAPPRAPSARGLTPQLRPPACAPAQNSSGPRRSPAHPRGTRPQSRARPPARARPRAAAPRNAPAAPGGAGAAQGPVHPSAPRVRAARA
jgi:hypothetical protein